MSAPYRFWVSAGGDSAEFGRDAGLIVLVDVEVDMSAVDKVKVDELMKIIEKQCRTVANGYLFEINDKVTHDKMAKQLVEYFSKITPDSSIENVKVGSPTWKEIYPKLWTRIMARIGYRLCKWGIIRRVYSSVEKPKFHHLIFPYKMSTAILYKSETYRGGPLENFIDSIKDPMFDFSNWLEENVTTCTSLALEIPDPSTLHASFSFRPTKPAEYVKIDLTVGSHP